MLPTSTALVIFPIYQESKPSLNTHLLDLPLPSSSPFQFSLPPPHILPTTPTQPNPTKPKPSPSTERQHGTIRSLALRSHTDPLRAQRNTSLPPRLLPPVPHVPPPYAKRDIRPPRSLTAFSGLTPQLKPRLVIPYSSFPQPAPPGMSIRMSRQWLVLWHVIRAIPSFDAMVGQSGTPPIFRHFQKDGWHSWRFP